MKVEPAPRPRRAGSDDSVVRVGDSGRDGEPDAASTGRPIEPWYSEEPFEHQRQIVGGDTDAVVGDRDGSDALVLVRTHDHAPPGGV